MIPHGEAVRNAVRVQWMRLGDLADLKDASRWAEAHGLSTHIAAGRVLIVWDDQSQVSATLGQWLTYQPDTGEFSAWSDERYQAMHSSEVASV